MQGLLRIKPLLLWYFVGIIAYGADHTQAPVFPLGVASGDPSPHGFTLITHLSQKYYESSNSVVTLEISPEKSFTTLAYQLPITITASLLSNQEITIKHGVDEPQLIAPNSFYYYRFRYGSHLSPIGRAHSLPLPNAHLTRLKLAIVTCQDYTTGNYHAFDYLADEPVDFLVHLGDAIYEYSRYPGVPSKDILRTIDLPAGVLGLDDETGVLKATTLADFRAIYRTTRADPGMRRVNQNHTWIYTRDDHEVADNSFWDYSTKAPGFPETDPRHRWSPEDRKRVMVAALQSWSEYLPMNWELRPGEELETALERFYKVYRFGTLVDLYALASRVLRSDPNAKGNRSMLGLQQKNCLIADLKSSPTAWQMLANQTMFSRLTVGLGGLGRIPMNRDAWDGFTVERQEIIAALATKPQIAVFTGDMHASLVSYIKRDYSHWTAKDRSNIVGAEFMTPSISSPNFTDVTRGTFKLSGFTPVARKIFKLFNPHLKHFHGGIYGYSIADIRPDRLDWYVYKIGKKDQKFKILRKQVTYVPAIRKLIKHPLVVPGPESPLQQE